jgi:vanillate O-demethylase ferredoxin subunit
MSALTVRVTQKKIEAEGVCSFELRLEKGGELPPFSAGAHIDVHIRPGVTRQYSLCNPPHERDRYQIAVLLEPDSRGGSQGMHAQVQVGQALTISAPRNHFELVPAQHSLLFAGGIGITPLLAMAHTLHAQGKSFELHYCGRSRNRMAFLNELNQLPFAQSVHVHCDDGPISQRLDTVTVLSGTGGEVRLYVCGPAGFMNHVLDIARKQGWPEDKLHREFFSAAHADTSNDGSFELKLAKTGESFIIPADKTVMQVLLSNGIDIPFSCESGVCGTCLTNILKGVPDHRDAYLTPQEQDAGDKFTPCCSRSKSSSMTLDL